MDYIKLIEDLVNEEKCHKAMNITDENGAQVCENHVKIDETICAAVYNSLRLKNQERGVHQTSVCQHISKADNKTVSA